MEFFKHFTQEYQSLRSNGIELNEKYIPIYIRGFIADASVRAFVLNHYGHNSKNPCSKCKIIGKSIERRMTFLTCNNELRTDIDYLNAIDKAHHLPNNESALKSLRFQMVTRVPFEYMHLICLVW